MIEYIAQMGPMLVVAGLIVAWLAGTSSKGGGYGFLPDMALGLIGSVAAGAISWAAVSSAPGMLAMFGIGGLGAILLIVAQRGLWHG
jgi:uncharacterized membrane protein YeaQ/YmgE (transglycosylase-associated protein family)